MKFRKVIAIIIILGVLNINTIMINAQENTTNNSDVKITTDIDLLQATQQINGIVHIQFHKTELFNDMVKFSYHIYDKNNNALVYENERIPFTLVDGKVDIPISIDLKANDKTANMKNVMIRFDLVDEQNVYWFNDNPGIKMQSIEIAYKSTFLSRIKEIYGNVATKQTLQLAISLLFIFLMSIVYKKYKKSNQ